MDVWPLVCIAIGFALGSLFTVTIAAMMLQGLLGLMETGRITATITGNSTSKDRQKTDVAVSRIKHIFGCAMWQKDNKVVPPWVETYDFCDCHSRSPQAIQSINNGMMTSWDN